MAHEDKSEREILLLLVQQVQTHLENHKETHATINSRLDSHSNQLKLLWGGGGLVTTIAGLFGMKGGGH